MKYEEIQCGMRVVCKQGPGEVKTFDAYVPGLRNLFGGLAELPPVLRARVLLDSGKTVRVAIENLRKE